MLNYLGLKQVCCNNEPNNYKMIAAWNSLLQTGHLRLLNLFISTYLKS